MWTSPSPWSAGRAGRGRVPRLRPGRRRASPARRGGGQCRSPPLQPWSTPTAAWLPREGNSRCPDPPSRPDTWPAPPGCRSGLSRCGRRRTSACAPPHRSGRPCRRAGSTPPGRPAAPRRLARGPRPWSRPCPSPCSPGARPRRPSRRGRRPSGTRRWPAAWTPGARRRAGRPPPPRRCRSSAAACRGRKGRPSRPSCTPR
mmetsp:Transcript_2158/g.6442  ORF Transcript_2158/g.6442 Transcript_2158/m.6442 type:complete len:201 (-) Transcript_2158:1077-1679(-)